MFVMNVFEEEKPVPIFPQVSLFPPLDQRTPEIQNFTPDSVLRNQFSDSISSSMCGDSESA